MIEGKEKLCPNQCKDRLNITTKGYIKNEMNKRLLLLFAFMTAFLSASAQHSVSGTVVENDNGEAMAMATVKLMRQDSTLVQGAKTSVRGTFNLSAPKAGKYILSISNVGFNTLYRNLNIQNKDINLGSIGMSPSSVMLKETTITGQAVKVAVKEDTLVFNAAAMRTPEGAVLEELVKKLPGAEVSDEGKITINGKEVKKILVDGKEFMTGDTQTALKNLPSSIIDKIKAYDEKSDLARVSGIDDGEEETVLDFGIKKGMNRGFISNTFGGIGTDSRYTARTMLGHFNSDLKLMTFGNANNVGDRGFGGGRGGRGGGQGLNASKMLGVNMSYEKKDVIKVDGHVRWNHNDGDAWSKSSTESFVNTAGSFSNSERQNFSRSNNWSTNFRVEWTPDTMTNIMFRPSFSLSSSDGMNTSRSATYKYDPYQYDDISDPLSEEGLSYLSKIDSMLINSRNNSSISYSETTTFGGMLQFNRRLNSKGRNFTIRVNGNYSDKKNKSFSTNNVHLYQVKNAFGADSTYQTNRFNITPSKNYNYRVRATYSEPIMKATFLQLSYQFQYKYNESDRSTYDFSNLGESYFEGLALDYRGWDDYLARLYNPYESYLDKDLSRYSEYRNWIHTIELMLRIVRKDFNFNAGITLQPQKTNFMQNYQGHEIDTTRTVTNISPTMRFRWKISKVSQLNINYRGNTDQPSMSDLTEITDDSDPLNISTGNSGLKPSFTHSLRANYNNFIQHRTQAIAAHLNFSTTSNSVARKVTYNPETGGRLTRPENINGNWNVNGFFMYNCAIDTTGYFNVNTSTNIGYNNSVGYVTLNRNSSSEKTTTRTTSIGERLGASYRNDWFEFELSGSLNYQHARNTLQPNNNLDTWRYTYGFDTNIQLPWNMQISTNMNMNSRRGYSDASLNTDELIWNAQISQSMLKKNALTLMLQFYDILRQQSSFSRTINAMQRSDTEYNSITSYAMLTANFKFNAFPGGGRGDMGPRGDRPRGPHGGFGGGNRGRRGGFGGPGF